MFMKLQYYPCFFNFCSNFSYLCINWIKLLFHCAFNVLTGFNYLYFVFNAFTHACLVFCIYSLMPPMCIVCTRDWEYRETILTLFLLLLFYCGFKCRETSENLERLRSYVQRFPRTW